MIRRTMEKLLRRAAETHPVVTVTGPRQSGKTTLCRATFPRKPYANLELPDVRSFAGTDPRAFLDGFPDGAVLDEIQRAPELLSWIQDRVDRRRQPGEFVLTGSQHLGLLDSVSQSLAGRSAVLHLLPCAREEVERFPDHPEDLFETMLWGGYPAIHDRGIGPGEWFAGYVTTYVERDVRQVLNVGDLAAFQTFLELLAGSTAQVLNLSSLGSSAGVSHNTVRAWLSVLEAGYLVFRLTPFHRNLKKRLTRRPKIHFLDSGLACYLLGISTKEQLRTHPLRGALFESWVAAEVRKARLNRGLRARLHFYRDHKGEEVDLVVDTGASIVATEMKSGATVPSDAFRALDRFARLCEERLPDAPPVRKVLVYGGDEPQARSSGTVLPWSGIPHHDWS